MGNSEKRDVLSEILTQLLIAATSDPGPDYCFIGIQRQAGKVVSFKIEHSVDLKSK